MPEAVQAEAPGAAPGEGTAVMPRVVFESTVPSSMRKVRIVEIELHESKTGMPFSRYVLERSNGKDTMGQFAWETVIRENTADWNNDDMNFVVQELGRRCAAETANA